MKIGLALSGGGARGIAHIGVLKALEEKGVSIAALSGASAGAIIGALYASGHTPDRILEIVMNSPLVKSSRLALAISGLFKTGGMKELLLKYMPDNRFDALKIPLTLAATDIRQGEVCYFSKGELIPAILASCNVPVLFKPLAFDGGLYVDGGILDNLPSRCLVDQCDFIIGSHCNQIPKGFEPKGLKDIAERTLLMAVNANTLTSKTFCNVIIEPPDLGRYGGYEISKAQEIFDLAYRYTTENFCKEDFLKAAHDVV
jgi:NTE family protein